MRPWISSTASQNDGIASDAIEITRTALSTHRSRYSAASTPSSRENTTAITSPRKVSWRVTGSASPTAVATGVRRAL